MATFTNQATLTYGDSVATSNVVTGELLQSIAATKYALTETYTADEILTYVVSLVNTGAAPLTDLTVTDDLGAYTRDGVVRVPLDYVEGSIVYYVDGIRQGTPAVIATNPLTVTGITVPGGGNAFLVYQARVNEFASPEAGAIITNTVSVTGDCLSTPATAQETVRAASEAYLTIDKSLSPTTVTEGDRLTYTFVIRNFGNTPVVATDDATVTDTFDPILSDLTVTFNGTAWAEGVQYTYDEATGVFATIPTNVTVPSATYTRNPVSGAWTVMPGVSTLVVVGTV